MIRLRTDRSKVAKCYPPHPLFFFGRCYGYIREGTEVVWLLEVHRRLHHGFSHDGVMVDLDFRSGNAPSIFVPLLMKGV